MVGWIIKAGMVVILFYGAAFSIYCVLLYQALN